MFGRVQLPGLFPSQGTAWRLVLIHREAFTLVAKKKGNRAFTSCSFHAKQNTIKSITNSSSMEDGLSSAWDESRTIVSFPRFFSFLISCEQRPPPLSPKVKWSVNDWSVNDWLLGGRRQQPTPTENLAYSATALKYGMNFAKTVMDTAERVMEIATQIWALLCQRFPVKNNHT